MAGSYGTPLAEFLKFFEGVAAGERENALEHRRHMAGIKEESVAGDPAGVTGVIY